MKFSNDPPRKKKKRPSPGTQPENVAGDTDRGKPAPEGPARNQEPSPEEVARTWTNPVTNQDEQDKITNTGGENLPIPDK